MKVGILPTSRQIDFQVEAMIGYRDRGVYSDGIMPYVFKGEKSGWSNTQTIIIDGSAPTATPDAQQGLNWAEISVFAALGVIVALLVAIALMRRKQTKK